MYFSNMLCSESKTFARGGKEGTYPFVCEFIDRVNVGAVTIKEKQLVVGGSSEDIFCRDIAEHQQKSDIYNKEVGCKLTYGQVADTEENPLITVLCKGIYFYEGVKSFIKFINLGSEGVLACLVYGACDFEFFDGDVVTMQRCNDQSLDRKRYYYNGAKLMQCFYAEDKESGYNYAYDAVFGGIISIGVLKGEMNFRYRTVKDKTYLFSTEGIEAAREKERKRKEEAARKAEAHRLERARMQEEYNRSQIEKAKQESMEKAEKAKKTRTTKKEEVVTELGSAGAAAFLQAVAQLK